MLGIVFAGHSGFGSGMMKALTQLLGARPIQCIGVEFSDGVSSNMLSRMMCDALHQVDSGDGVVIIADILGAPPFRAAVQASTLRGRGRCQPGGVSRAVATARNR